MAEGVAAADSLSFEAALAELETIVRSLETGKGDLARAIADYERGTLLRRHCETLLADAEAKVQAISQGPDGAITLRELE
jgi:exodeoxyribonuclease VII small subunit